MTDRPILSRRSFLAALGLTGAAALLAGCGGSPRFFFQRGTRLQCGFQPGGARTLFDTG